MHCEIAVAVAEADVSNGSGEGCRCSSLTTKSAFFTISVWRRFFVSSAAAAAAALSFLCTTKTTTHRNFFQLSVLVLHDRRVNRAWVAEKLGRAKGASNRESEEGGGDAQPTDSMGGWTHGFGKGGAREAVGFSMSGEMGVGEGEGKIGT